MHHVRSRHRPRFKSVICGLTTRPRDSREPYTLAVIAGARTRAEELGYGFMVMQVAEEPAAWPGLQRTLHSRGVQGVLLLPQQRPIDLTGLCNWAEFSVVSASTSVLAPGVNRVTPDHFSNGLLLCRELAARGYRRLGYVTSGEHDVRVKHGFDAAVVWHGLREAVNHVPPLIMAQPTAEVLVAWFRREKPDVVIGSNFDELEWIRQTLKLRMRGRVGLACTTTVGLAMKEISGIDERPRDVGLAAVDLLAGMVTTRVCGLPTSATSTVVPGVWKEGRSCRGRISEG
jgi:LacI family transcriptional regulator